MKNERLEKLKALSAFGTVCDLYRLGETVECIADGMGLSQECVNRVISFAPMYEAGRVAERAERRAKFMPVTV